MRKKYHIFIFQRSLGLVYDSIMTMIEGYIWLKMALKSISINQKKLSTWQRQNLKITTIQKRKKER